MNPGIDPLSQTLGEIIAKVDMVLTTQAEDRKASAIYRTDMRRDLGEVKDTANDLKNRTNHNSDEIAEMREDVDKKIAAIRVDVDDYRRRRDQAEGASKLTKILWAVFSAIGLGGAITFLQSFMHKPHP